jgi:thiol-disulfide isomerase/thioredoxin
MYKMAIKRFKTAKAPTPSVTDKIMKYVMISALVLLLVFAIMYVYNIQKAAKETFENTPGGFKVIYMYMESCGYCKQFAPIWDEYSKENKPANIVAVEKHSKVDPAAAEYLPHVTAFPTILIMDAATGGLVAKQTGSVDIQGLRRFVSDNTVAK